MYPPLFKLETLIVPQVVGMNWIEIPAGKYQLVTGKDMRSRCQVELTVR